MPLPGRSFKSGRYLRKSHTFPVRSRLQHHHSRKSPFACGRSCPNSLGQQRWRQAPVGCVTCGLQTERPRWPETGLAAPMIACGAMVGSSVSFHT